MSKIQAALATATDTEPSKRKNETITDQEYMRRLAAAVAGLSDEEWAKLPVDAQDWYNAAADSIEAKRDIDVYPDLPKPAAAEATTTRRRGATAAEPAKSAEPVKGDKVEVVTKRGRTYTGVIVELDDAGMVLDVDGKDVELDRDKLDSVKVVGGGATAAAEPEGPADPEVGDTLQVVTKRGKTIMGVVKELTDDEMVLEDSAGEVHELSKDKLTSVAVKVKGAAGAGASSKAAETKKDDKKPEPEKKKITAASNGGVSVTARMRELICANMDAKKDGIAEMLKKETLEFKQATLDLTYADTHKVLAILREQKKLK